MELDRAVIDAQKLKALQGRVSNVAQTEGSGILTFSWSTRIPMPIDPAWDKPLAAQDLNSSEFNVQTLKIIGLPAREYVLHEGDTRLGEVSSASLERGIDLRDYANISTKERSQALWKIVAQRERLLSPAWLERVGHKRPGTPKGLPFDEARRQAEPLDEKIRVLSQPVALAIRVVPAVDR
jgi:hypothetical protein